MDNRFNKTVFVVDDDCRVREALQWLLESIALPVETFVSADHFLKSYNPERLGCLIIDVRMPGMSGLELLAHLKSVGCQLPVIVITGYGDIPMAVRAMQAGAVNFISKPLNEQYLIDLIQEIFRKKPLTDPSLSIKKIINCFAELTPRERAVISLLTEGKLNKQIAFDLNISLSTVELARSNIMKKMQAKTLAQLIRNYVLIESMVIEQ
ncbi:MAG: response regulator [Legionella sp.]|nr:response regulator [Legionella sp.]